MREIAWLAILAVALLSACVDNDSGSEVDASSIDADPSTPDANANVIDAVPGPDACTGAPDLNVLDDGTGRLPTIVISEIGLTGDYLEVFNTATSAATLSGLGEWRWCTGGGGTASYTLVTTNPITIPGRSYATIPFPINPTNGELVLYNSASYLNSNSVMDYVCWDNGGVKGRQPVAKGGAKWDDGGCVADIPAKRCAEKERSAWTARRQAHYEIIVAEDPTNCGP